MRASVRLNLVLFVVLAVLVAAHWAMPSDPTQRNFHFFPNMVDSLAHEAQAPAPVLASGFQLDLQPPAGSVARGYLPLLYEATPEDALRAGAELQSPNAADDAAAVERGRFVFATFCATCHGPAGEGDGPVTRRGVPPPPSLLLPHALELADGQLYHISTFGQGNMAGYASQVGRDDRWHAVSFIRTLQAAATAAPEAAAATPEASEEATAVPEEAAAAPEEPAAEATTATHEEIPQ